MNERWFKQAVIYSLDIETFQDSNGDGAATSRASSPASTISPGWA